MNRQDKSRLFGILMLGLSLGLACGCGDGRPRRVSVSGEVRIDGEPLSCGFVRLVPDDARPATGHISPQGRFRLSTFESGDGCVLGTHCVIVIAYDEADPRHVRWLVPEKYTEVATSDVTATIDGPTDSLVIDLAWGGEKPLVLEFAGDADPSEW